MISEATIQEIGNRTPRTDYDDIHGHAAMYDTLSLLDRANADNNIIPGQSFDFHYGCLVAVRQAFLIMRYADRFSSRVLQHLIFAVSHKLTTIKNICSEVINRGPYEFSMRSAYVDADCFHALPKIQRATIRSRIAQNRSVDFYHGCYYGLAQAGVLADNLPDSLDQLALLRFGIAVKIVELVEMFQG